MVEAGLVKIGPRIGRPRPLLVAERLAAQGHDLGGAVTPPPPPPRSRARTAPSVSVGRSSRWGSWGERQAPSSGTAACPAAASAPQRRVSPTASPPRRRG